MKHFLVTAFITLFFSMSYGQEKVAFLEEICIQIDQHLGPEKVAELKGIVTNEKILLSYELPSEYWNMLDFLELNDWEGPLHDSLRGLIDHEFVSDFSNTESLVFQYYLAYVSGNVFDVRAALMVQWEEEIEDVNLWREERAKHFNSIQVGDLVYFYPNIIKIERSYPYDLDLLDEGPFEIIKCKVIARIDSTESYEVLFIDNIKGVKHIAAYLNEKGYFFFDNINRDNRSLEKVQKNKPYIFDAPHFSKTPLVFDFRYLTFPFTYFQSANKQFKLQRTDESIIMVEDGSDWEVVRWDKDSFKYKGEVYKVVYDKNYKVQYIQNLQNKEKLLPVPTLSIPGMQEPTIEIKYTPVEIKEAPKEYPPNTIK